MLLFLIYLLASIYCYCKVSNIHITNLSVKAMLVLPLACTILGWIFIIMHLLHVYCDDDNAGSSESSYKANSHKESSYGSAEIEIKVNPMIFLFESCCFEGNTAYLYYHNHKGGIKIDCRTGSYSEIGDAIKRADRCSEVYRGSIQYGFVNTIIVFYQLTSGCNWFSSVENVLNSFPHQANNEFRKYNLKMEMTRSGLTFTHNGQSVSLEDVACILLNDAQCYNQRVHRSLSLTEGWDVIISTVEQRISDDYGFIIPKNTTNFSATAYICPRCYNHLSKILLPRDTTIKIEGERCRKLAGCMSVKINKAFACKKCNLFLAPFPNEKLDSGRSLRLQVDSQRFNELVQMMDENYRLPNY